MSLLIYAHYDSVDAAELSAMQLKNRIRGVEVAGVSKRRHDDESEETTLSVFPANTADTLSTGSTFASTGATSLPYGLFLGESAQDDRIEPAGQGDAYLRVQAEDMATARRAAAVLRASGGREVRIADRQG